MDVMDLLPKLNQLRKQQDELTNWEKRVEALRGLQNTLNRLTQDERFSEREWLRWVLDPMSKFGASPSLQHFPTGLMLISVDGVFSLRKAIEATFKNILAGNCSFIHFSIEESEAARKFAGWLGENPYVASFSAEVSTLQFLLDHPAVQAYLLWASMDLPVSTATKKWAHIKDGVVTAIAFEPPSEETVQMLVDSVLSLNGKNPYAPQRLLVLEKDMPDWLQKLDQAFHQNNFAIAGDLSKCKEMVLKEEGHSVGQHANVVLVRDLPQCSTLHQTPIAKPLLLVNSVKYRHEFAKWVNNSQQGFAVWILGEEDTARKVAQSQQVGHVWLNKAWMKDQELPWGVKDTGQGINDRRIFGLFFSNRQEFVS